MSDGTIHLAHRSVAPTSISENTTALWVDTNGQIRTTQSSGLSSNLGAGLFAGGRLTLTTGTPVTTSDVTSATSLYFTPYGPSGNKISLFDGTNWQLHSFSELSDTNAGFTASKPHDIFLDWNGGSPQLEKLAWTDATTRATALTYQDGREVLTGALDWNYVATVYADASSQFNDSVLIRGVWNRYNQEKKLLYKYDGSSHIYGTGTWRAWNDDSANTVYFVSGLSRLVNMYISRAQLDPDTTGYVRLYLDNSELFQSWIRSDATTYNITLNSISNPLVVPGYHSVVAQEYSSGNTTFSTIVVSADILC